MKITTTVEAFVAALKASVTEKKGTIPIIQYVKVSGTTITGTDLDLFSVIPFKGKATGKEEFTISPKQAIANLTGENGPLTIEYIGKKKKDASKDQPNVKMTISGCEFTQPTMNVANFPLTPEEANPAFKMDGDAFKLLLERTRFAISHEESRYTLNGALLKTIRDTVMLVATDGHRLSLTKSPVEGVPYSGDEAIHTIILNGTLGWLKANMGETISIGVKDGYQTFKSGSKTLIAKTLTGQFPNWEAVMPCDNPLKAEIASAKKFGGILTRVAKCADARSGAVQFAFGTKDSYITAASSENGSAKAAIDITLDKAVTIGLNSDYILEFLKVVGDVPVKISIRDHQSSVLLSVDNFDYIVMPMRI